MRITTGEYEIVLTLSTLVKRNITIQIDTAGRRVNNSKIDEYIKEYLLFINSITSGTTYRIENNIIEFSPGTLTGGSISFRCKYYTVPQLIYYTLPLYGYCKIPITLRVKGCTNKSSRTNTSTKDTLLLPDVSIDTLKHIYSKVLSRFGVLIDISIEKRSMYPSKEGIVIFTCNQINTLNTIRLDSRESLNKIVCINYSNRINSSIINRITNTERDTIKKTTNKIKIFNDIGNKTNSDISPGYGILLMALCNNGIYFTETAADGTVPVSELLPEELVTEQTKILYKSIRTSGIYDHKLQTLLLILLSINNSDCSTLLIRDLSQENKEVLSILEKVVKYTYTIEKYHRNTQDINTGVSDNLFLIKSCGLGYKNINK
ncbi:RNA 3'-terminal phosphate cyclase-like protein [Nematocida sp. AWRm80]|nr:RNA 3'-terminal phosphate cyclase-like protein [Nematocida sp. AWRm80]